MVHGAWSMVYGPAVAVDLAELPYQPALLQWPRPTVCWPPSLVVIHDMEAPETGTTAEACALWFQNPAAGGSTHVVVDQDSAIRCVHDDRKSAGAKSKLLYRGKTVNDWAVQVEQAGYARQTREEWLDASSTSTMHMAARVVAAWCDLYTIPPYRLTDEQLRAGLHGIVGHGDVSRALAVPHGHTDPGANYPWDLFLPLVQGYMEDDMWTPEEKARLLAGADASVAMAKLWDPTGRAKVDDLWTQLMDRDNPAPGYKKGTVGAQVQRTMELVEELDARTGPAGS